MSEDGRETAGVTTRLVVAYVRSQLGEAAVEDLLTLAGDPRPREVLEDERLWSSYRQKIALFEAAATLTGDADVARRIGESVLAEQLGGVVRAVIGAMGSPQRVLRSVASANAKFSTSATMRALSVAVGQATVTYRLHPGHVPSRHDCLYTQGILSQVTVLFGLPPAAIIHGQCQIDGAYECTYEVSWPRWRWWLRGVGRRRSDIADVALHERIKDLERTVVDLVAVDDLEHALERIASRAGAAVHAQRHLLAARVGTREFVYADGLGHTEAEELGRELLATGAVRRHASQQLVAPIVSARRAYGWLAAFLPAEAGFLPAEQEHLEAYAGLAAAALDVASSLEEARRNGQVSEALLLLGRQLAHETDEHALANRVAEAAPLVSGADRARVMLWDADQQCLTTAAAVGFGPLTEPALAFEMSAVTAPVLREFVLDPTPRRFERGDDASVAAALDRFGSRSVSVAPIVGDAELIGMVLAAHADDRTTGGSSGSVAVPEVNLEALSGLADQAGVAIARLRLLHAARHAATHDHLTGLAGRELFGDRIERALADGRRTGRCTAVCFLDLDGFKLVNDTYGHAAGDVVLVEVARRIRGIVRETDSVARIAGDEFAVLLRDLADASGAMRVAESLVTALARPYVYEGRSLTVGSSIGVAVAPIHGTEPDPLLRAADGAMYRAKQRGGGCDLVSADPAPAPPAPAVR